MIHPHCLLQAIVHLLCATYPDFSSDKQAPCNHSRLPDHFSYIIIIEGTPHDISHDTDQVFLKNKTGGICAFSSAEVQMHLSEVTIIQ